VLDREPADWWECHKGQDPWASANTYVTRSICCSINVRRMTEFEGWYPGERGPKRASQ
jgi:hypothetical protein